MNLGMLYAALAYVIWGGFPIYFKALQAVPAEQVLLHRMVWSLVFLVAVLAVRRQWAWLRAVVRQPRVLLGFAASAVMLSINWFVWIWAVQHDHVIDGSLGYFINPLVNILLGALVFKEHLRRGQWLAVGIAALGVAWLTWQAGHLPWIGLALAFSFAAYGVLRKTAQLGALEGLALETLLLFPLAAGCLIWLSSQHLNAFGQVSTATQWLLAAAGPVTAIPLLLFAAGARRIPFSVLGMLQYIGPTLQLLVGVWLYHEPFGVLRLIGYSLIWFALAVYSLESVWWHRTTTQASNLATRTA